MNFVHGVFYIAIFSNMAQRQRARYRVARYFIVNNVTIATLESKSKNAWKRRWHVVFFIHTSRKRKKKKKKKKNQQSILK